MNDRSRYAAQQSVYGALVGPVKAGHEDPPGASSHYEIWVQGEGDWRVAVNVESTDDSEVLAYFAPSYTPPEGLDLASLAATPGFQVMATGAEGKGLDYLRDDLFPLDQMTAIPAVGNGVTLAGLIGAEVQKAMGDEGARW